MVEPQTVVLRGGSRRVCQPNQNLVVATRCDAPARIVGQVFRDGEIVVVRRGGGEITIGGAQGELSGLGALLQRDLLDVGLRREKVRPVIAFVDRGGGPGVAVGEGAHTQRDGLRGRNDDMVAGLETARIRLPSPRRTLRRHHVHRDGGHRALTIHDGPRDVVGGRLLRGDRYGCRPLSSGPLVEGSPVGV